MTEQEPILHPHPSPLPQGEREDKGRLFVLSGPSAVGKDAVLARMKAGNLPLHYVVTVTTRQMRPGEESGREYSFVSAEEFRQMREHNELLEWAEVYGNQYGVPRQEVERALDAGKDVILKLDVQGARTIRSLFPGAVLIFLEPSSHKELEERLRRRASSDAGRRLRAVESELQSLPLFDHVVVNHQDRLDSTVDRIVDIINREKSRTTTDRS